MSRQIIIQVPLREISVNSHTEGSKETVRDTIKMFLSPNSKGTLVQAAQMCFESYCITFKN